MTRRVVLVVIASLVALACSLKAALAEAPAAYETFTAGAQAQSGLFPVWHKGDKVYLELDKSQLDRDFLETITIGNGLAARTIVWGDTDYLPSEIVRFQRRGDRIVVLWPNWYAVAPGSSSIAYANQYNFPDSVVGTGAIAAESAAKVVFDASSLLGDVMDAHNLVNSGLPPGNEYSLSPSLSYFDATKAFPQNDVITVSQTWSTAAKHVIDTAPDARQLRIRVVYNFAQLPNDNYRPRYADDRVGLYDDIYLDFTNDRRLTRKLDYLVRWNFDPEDPSRPSRARHPFVFYLSNSIPTQYRKAVSDGILSWNAAFEKIGILDAVQVKPQPDDPAWDPDDIRYSVIRWVTEASPTFGADSQTLFDPRTGEEIRSGVLVSSTTASSPAAAWRFIVDPVRYGRNTDPVPEQFVHDSIVSTLMHETGHNLGMQHNFIGSMAYTASNLQNPAFTHKYGITTTAMEYAPLNIWPRSYGQGDYSQTVIGPYDYYAIKWGYANIPGANTPDEERPTLNRWAQAWNNPLYRYASDEDVSWQNGHAADPRVETGDLTSDPLSWCAVQMKMDRGLIASLPQREPLPGHEYEEERMAFSTILGSYLRCAALPAHWIGGQLVSRSHRGDPGAAPPIVPVPLSDQRRAMALLAENLFGDGLKLSPRFLQQLGYSERSGYSYTSWETYGNLPLWAYNPPDRHDYPVVERIESAQDSVLDYLLQPLVLQRLDENRIETSAPTLGLADFFAAMQAAIYAKAGDPNASIERRSLQIAYAKRLHDLGFNPPPKTPVDAQALARIELRRIHALATADEKRAMNDELRAHLSLLASITT